MIDDVNNTNTKKQQHITTYFLNITYEKENYSRIQGSDDEKLLRK